VNEIGAGERGMSVIETLIATALLVLAAFGGLAACRTVASVLAWSAGSTRGATDLDTQAAALRDDAASAFAIFVPADAATQPASEVDFYAKTAAGQPLLWRYVGDPVQQTLQRWDFDLAGNQGVRDITTGAIDTNARYPALTHITSFAAMTLPADQLGAAAHNPYNGLGALFVHPPRARAVRFGTADLARLGAVGGNSVIAVTLANEHATRVVHLVAGSLPTGFTVRGRPVWHAIIYRVDQTGRSSLGLVQKSHVFINVRIDVSYDGWATAPIRWCDFNLLGAPHGLDGDDPHANYTPSESFEHSDNLLTMCRQRHPTPPGLDSPGNPPDADAVGATP
jgi:hypothetical protein